MEISKQEFENVVSVATSAHVEVFEKVQPQFDTVYEDCKEKFLGDAGTQEAEGQTNTRLTEVVKRWVCLQAFLSVFRQLDLVLTPTGFGVVSTQQMAPASKQRVDALIGHLRDSLLLTEGRLLSELCKVQGWGSSWQAKEKITTLLFDFRAMKELLGPVYSHVEWSEAQRLVAEADENLRRKLSNEYMDALLDSVRSNTVSDNDRQIILYCRHIISLWVSGDREAIRLLMRRLLCHLDENLETYTIYAEHGYPVNHHETFQNTKDSPAFFFG